MEARIYNYSSWIDETDPKVLHDGFYRKLNDAGFGVLNVIEKHFNPQGYTALYLLSESHFAIHTFPEAGKTYIELSSCIPGPFDTFIKNL